MSLANRLLSTAGTLSVFALLLMAATCAEEGKNGSPPLERATPTSAETDHRLAELTARFEPLRRANVSTEGATALVMEPGGTITAGPNDNALIDVTLPSTADGEASIVDRATRVGARFSLIGARPSEPVIKGDVAIYPKAVGSSAVSEDASGEGDLLHRVSGASVEDFIAFDQRPAREELHYRVETQGAKALRLVQGQLELLDQNGVPRVRVAPPYVVDSTGARTSATMEVEGCAVDRDPRAPWGRSLTELGDATSCGLVIRWQNVAYPLLVDPEWTDSGFMLHERTHHTATLLPSGDVLLAGGFDALGAGIPDAEIMCPAEKCPPLAVFTPTGSLITARGGQTETLLNSGASVLFTGGLQGRSSTARLASAELYSIADGTFALTTGAMHNPRDQHTATLLDTTGGFKVLITGGDGITPTSTAELFDPVAETFALTTGTMVVQRHGHVAELLKSGKVLVAGGISSLDIAVASAELFDPTTGAFTATGNMTSQRAFATATRLEDTAGSILVTGGTNGVGFYYKTADLFIPNGTGGGSFQQQPIIMQAARANHVATKLLGTGTVLVTGGFDGTDLIQSAEVFDQQTAQFVLGASQMKHARAFHTGTRLPSGQVVVTGGGFDPNAGTVNFTTAISTETLERSNSEPCNVDTECASGFCVNTANIGKVCCDAECSGVCQACANDQTGQATGECHDVLDNTLVKPDCDNAVQLKLLCISGQVQAGNVLPCAPYACSGDKCGTDTCTAPADCSVDGYCSAQNGCQFKQELASQCSTDPQCKSGHCIDGFCCDTACDGQCEACDDSVHPGFCTQAVGKPHGTTRPACDGSGSDCEGVCGSTRASCDYAANDCGSSTCAAGVETSGTCSTTQTGTCVTGPKSCGPFACDSLGSRCVVTCNSTADCASGAVCQNGQCRVVESDACDGDHTVVSPDGTSQDCSPFKCNGAACINRCNSVDDCVSPNVCDDAGKCIPPPANPAPPSGCSVNVGISGNRDASESGLLMLMVCAFVSMAARRANARGGLS